MTGVIVEEFWSPTITVYEFGSGGPNVYWVAEESRRHGPLSSTSTISPRQARNNLVTLRRNRNRRRAPEVR